MDTNNPTNKRTIASLSITKSPSQEWESNFKSTLNRLATQYLLLLRAASSEVALEDKGNDDEEDNMDVDSVGVVGRGSSSSSSNVNNGVGVSNLVDPRGEIEEMYFEHDFDNLLLDAQ